MFLNYLGSEIDYKFNTEPEKKACLSSPEQRCYWPRGKVLGGTSVINGMMYIRGNPSDYNDWAESNPGWSWDEVLPYFKKSEDNMQLDEMDPGYHSKGGIMPISKFPYTPPISKSILRGGEELGFPTRDLNGANTTGFMIAQTFSKNGIRMSSARAFLRPAAKRSNLHIIVNSTVSRILIDEKTKTVKGVEVIDADGHTKKINIKKEVIVSGGAVGFFSCLFIFIILYHLML